MKTVGCPVHKRYQGKREPTRECVGCWKLWVKEESARLSALQKRLGDAYFKLIMKQRKVS